MSTMKVLIVEASNLIQIQLTKIFNGNEENVSVKQAYSYKEALDIFPRYWPDTILLDSSLLDGSSFILLQVFKKVNPKVKVIIMASFPSPQFKKVCLDFGAADFFEKSNIDHLFFSKIKHKKTLLD